MGFTLSIKKAPWFSEYWFADFSWGGAYSGWLGIDEPWNYPYGAHGATDLEILVVDSKYNIKHSITGLGPIYDGKTYVYDCSSQQLSEVAPESKFANIVIFPPQPTEVTNQNQTVRFPVKFDHIGSQDTITLYAAVGDQSWYFNEVLHGEQRIAVPASDNWQSHYSYVDILMTPSISPGIYDAYVKIKEISLVSQALINCLTIKEVAPPPEEFSGAITRIELEHDSAAAPIPVLNVPQGERGLVHVWGRNDMTSTQQLGISWEVKDPDGVVVDKHTEWEMWPYAGPGVEKRFVSGRFDLSKVGTYMINTGLYMNQDSPVLVDSYAGKLCIVEAVAPESEFANIVIFPTQPAEVTNQNQTVRFPVKFDHIGSQDTITLYAAVGSQNLIFNEVLHGEQRIAVPASDNWQSHYSYVDILLTPSISPGVYDAYVKIKETNLVSQALIGCLTVKEGAPPEEFSGTITRIELNHDGAQAPLPIIDVAQAEKGILHVWGRNDMTATQQIGISWEAKDPDGIVVQTYQDWEEWPYTSPGGEHHFIGPRLDLIKFDKVGTYTINARLYMNHDSPVLVDTYAGDLCAVAVEEIPPEEYELVQHTIYPYAYVYDGDVEVSTFTCKTASFVPSQWAAEKLASALEDKVKEKGGRVIELKVYADLTPLMWTDFRIEVTGTPLGGATEVAPGVGVAIGIPIWAAILIAALAIAFLIVVITWSVKTIAKVFKHQPLSEEIKAVWSKETLISAINDFEVKLDRTPTPPLELEEKSDDALRDYCDELAEEVAPSGVSWWPVAVMGGVVVVGAVAAFALSKRKS